MHKITIDGQQSFEVEAQEGVLEVNGETIDWDLHKSDDRKFHAIYKNESYRLELVEVAQEEKTITLKVNGKLYEVQAKDRLDLLLEKMGIDASASQMVNELKAPMPGLVLDMLVEEGQTVAKGDKLLILEAMKMENVLKSPVDATISSIAVEKGVSVEKNQLLIKFS